MTARALIIVDVQNDFCEGGALPIGGGRDVARKIGLLLKEARTGATRGGYKTVVASKDWHEDPGPHFLRDSSHPDKANGWPPHCLPHTWGSEFAPETFPNGNAFDYVSAVFYKGIFGDGYSAFQGVSDPSVQATWQPNTNQTLRQFLRAQVVDAVDVVGLALDFCVKATALDARSWGYETRVLRNYTAAVDKAQEDPQSALMQMLLEKGVTISS